MEGKIMATLRTKLAHEVVALNAERSYTLDGETTLCRDRWALRSDGKVLRRAVWTETPGSGAGKYQTPNHPDRLAINGAYSVFGVLKDGTPLTADTLRRLVERRGYTVVS